MSIIGKRQADVKAPTPVRAKENVEQRPKPESPLDRAQSYRRAGMSVIPIKCDGSKAPLLISWDEFMRRRATKDEVRTWFSGEAPPGIGIVGGEVSGGLLVLDFEFLDFFEEWRSW